MNAQSKSVLTMGELLWDMLPDGKKPGGAPANFVYHAAQNGVKATAVTAVGDDELGRELVRQRGRANQRIRNRHHRRLPG